MIRYIVAHWRDELTLGLSFWINGVVAYLTIIALLVAVGRVVPVIAGLLLFVAFLAWAIVGIVRSALAVVRSSAAPIRRKSYACAALSIMVVAVAKTAVDAVAFALLVRG